MTPQFLDRLDQTEREWTIAALTYIAYADGEVVKAEKETIMSIFPRVPREQLTSFMSKMQKKFQASGEFPLPPLQYASKHVKIELLQTLIELSSADSDLSEHEKVKVHEIGKILEVEKDDIQKIIEAFETIVHIRKKYEA